MTVLPHRMGVVMDMIASKNGAFQGQIKNLRNLGSIEVTYLNIGQDGHNTHRATLSRDLGSRYYGRV